MDTPSTPAELWRYLALRAKGQVDPILVDGQLARVDSREALAAYETYYNAVKTYLHIPKPSFFRRWIFGEIPAGEYVVTAPKPPGAPPLPPVCRPNTPAAYWQYRLAYESGECQNNFTSSLSRVDAPQVLDAYSNYYTNSNQKGSLPTPQELSRWLMGDASNIPTMFQIIPVSSFSTGNQPEQQHEQQHQYLPTSHPQKPSNSKDPSLSATRVLVPKGYQHPNQPTSKAGDYYNNIIANVKADAYGNLPLPFPTLPATKHTQGDIQLLQSAISSAEYLPGAQVCEIDMVGVGQFRIPLTQHLPKGMSHFEFFARVLAFSLQHQHATPSTHVLQSFEEEMGMTWTKMAQLTSSWNTLEDAKELCFGYIDCSGGRHPTALALLSRHDPLRYTRTIGEGFLRQWTLGGGNSRLPEDMPPTKFAAFVRNSVIIDFIAMFITQAIFCWKDAKKSKKWSFKANGAILFRLFASFGLVAWSIMLQDKVGRIQPLEFTDNSTWWGIFQNAKTALSMTWTFVQDLPMAIVSTSLSFLSGTIFGKHNPYMLIIVVQGILFAGVAVGITAALILCFAALSPFLLFFRNQIPFRVFFSWVWNTLLTMAGSSVLEIIAMPLNMTLLSLAFTHAGQGQFFLTSFYYAVLLALKVGMNLVLRSILRPLLINLESKLTSKKTVTLTNSKGELTTVSLREEAGGGVSSIPSADAMATIVQAVVSQNMQDIAQTQSQRLQAFIGNRTSGMDVLVSVRIGIVQEADPPLVDIQFSTNERIDDAEKRMVRDLVEGWKGESPDELLAWANQEQKKRQLEEILKRKFTVSRYDENGIHLVVLSTDQEEKDEEEEEEEETAESPFVSLQHLSTIESRPAGSVQWSLPPRVRQTTENKQQQQHQQLSMLEQVQIKCKTINKTIKTIQNNLRKKQAR